MKVTPSQQQQETKNMPAYSLTTQAHAIAYTCVQHHHDYSDTVDKYLATLLYLIFTDEGYAVSITHNSDDTATLYAAHNPE